MIRVLAVADRDTRIVVCPAHADPLARMAMLSAVTIAEACPWCKVQYRPRIREGDKPPDPIVFGPCPPT